MADPDNRSASRRGLVLWGMLAYLWGAVAHLRLGAYRPGLIWGDSGDGLFAIWVLRHGADWLRGLAPLADGRIFWPHHALSAFWSELYLLLAPLFLLLQKLTLSSFAVAYAMGVLLSVVAFFACLFFVAQVLAIARDPDRPPVPNWVPPLVAYLAWFSIGLLQIFKLQVLPSFWLLVMTGGMLAWRRTGLARWMLLVWASLAAVFLSSSYFAAAGVLLFAAWAWIEWFRDPGAWWRSFLKLWPALLAGAAAMGAVALMMSRPGVQRYSPEYIHSLAIGWLDLVRPRDGLISAGWLRSLTGAEENPSNIGAFLGWGWIAAAAAWLVRARREVWSFLKQALRSRWFVALALVLLAGRLKIREVRALMAIPGFLAVGLALLVAAAAVGRRGRDKPRFYAMGLLALFAALLFGLALGPSGWYVGRPLHPSVWSVLRVTIPGVAAMRAIDRMAVVAVVFAWGWLLAALAREWDGSKQPRARFWLLALLLPAALQAADALPARARATVQDEGAITPTLEERVFWENKTGVAVVFPAGPLYRNTLPMLYFQNFPGIILVNGYSARSTDLMDGLAQAGPVVGEGSLKQVAACEKAGADWIVLLRSEVPEARIEVLEQSGRRLVFDGDRLAIFEPLGRGYTPSTSRME